MTAFAIAITSVCIIVAAFYNYILRHAEESDLTDEELAEMSVDHEWWHAN